MVTSHFQGDRLVREEKRLNIQFLSFVKGSKDLISLLTCGPGNSRGRKSSRVGGNPRVRGPSKAPRNKLTYYRTRLSRHHHTNTNIATNHNEFSGLAPLALGIFPRVPRHFDRDRWLAIWMHRLAACSFHVSFFATFLFIRAENIHMLVSGGADALSSKTELYGRRVLPSLVSAWWEWRMGEGHEVGRHRWHKCVCVCVWVIESDSLLCWQTVLFVCVLAFTYDKCLCKGVYKCFTN